MEFSFTAEFITLRGAKIYNLVGPVINKLKTYSSSDKVVTRLAAGINDLTTFVYDSNHEKRVLKPSAHTADSLFTELLKFKEAILTARPKTFVVFTTIPPVSFSKFQTSKKLTVPIISVEDIHIFQLKLNDTIDNVNTKIQEHNQLQQQGISFTTLFWHNSVRKTAKCTRRGKTKYVVRNHFAHLYDRLHGSSKLKQQWFLLMYKAFAKDRQVLSEIKS